MRPVEIEPERHAQLRALYQFLLHGEERYDRFKELLSMYPPDLVQHDAQHCALLTGELVNATLRDWVGERFQALSAADLLLWRAIVVEERFTLPAADATAGPEALPLGTAQTNEETFR